MIFLSGYVRKCTLTTITPNFLPSAAITTHAHRVEMWRTSSHFSNHSIADCEVGSYLHLRIRLDHKTVVQRQRNISERSHLILIAWQTRSKVHNPPWLRSKTNQNFLKFLVGAERTKSELVRLGLED